MTYHVGVHHLVNGIDAGVFRGFLRDIIVKLLKVPSYPCWRARSTSHDPIRATRP